MKQTTKNVGKFFAVAMLSATVAGVTTYALMPEERAEMTSFVEQFPQSVQVMPTMFGSSSAGAMDLTKAAEASVNAVVHIKSTQLGKVQTVQQPMDLFDFFFGNPYGGGGRQRQVQTQPRVGFGSGVIISTDGYIVTNNHVIEGADEISVKLNDSREFVGRIIGTDPNTDLALVKSLSALQLGEQYVAVTEKACDEIRIEKEIEISYMERRFLQDRSEENRAKGVRLANDICKNYRREGKFFDEILDEAK